LQVNGITLGYDGQAVLKDVSIEASPGEVVGIIGPNGSGKSTLVRAISGVLFPSSGRIVLSGQDIFKLPRYKLARLVAVVPQGAYLPEAFTSLETVLLGRYPHLGLFRHESQRDVGIALEAMERTGIASLAERRVSQLSGGERQRLLIARALAQEPEVILLDEPTAHLDVQHQIQVMELVQNLTAQGVSAIVAIHDFSLAARFCHRLVLLSDGRVMAEGPPDLVMTAANIEAAFGVQALVYHDVIGDRLVISPFLRRERTEQCHIHVIGGGGRGAKAIQMLHAEGFQVTAGVLNEGDADLAVALALCHEVVVVPSFATIDQWQHEHNRRLAARADCVVVGDMPFGKANLLNLVAAAEARQLVFIDDTPFEKRDFADGKASALYSQLSPRARHTMLKDLTGCVEDILTGGKVTWRKS
jgi:iron complex transport system ATP-binding protein